MVKVEDLTVKFGDFTAVDKINFSVEKGEIFGFLGANGAGKTTTIRVLCGLLHPTSGNVNVAGTKFDNAATKEQELEIKKNVGYMSQKFTLYTDLTVKENLDFIASLRAIDPKTLIKRRKELLDFISFHYPLDSMVRDLSGGVSQQVALAAAILHDPDIVFLDEPTAGVTPATRARFWKLIHELAERGKTVFVTTHYMDEAEQCERIALMRDGKIVALDKPSVLKEKSFPKPLYEMEIKENEDYLKIRELKDEHPELDYFEPFGMHFHMTFKSGEKAEQLKNKLDKEYALKKIEPTLEDVFIRLTEGEEAT